MIEKQIDYDETANSGKIIVLYQQHKVALWTNAHKSYLKHLSSITLVMDNLLAHARCCNIVGWMSVQQQFATR